MPGNPGDQDAIIKEFIKYQLLSYKINIFFNLRFKGQESSRRVVGE